MRAELSASFDCRATSAVLRSGGSIAVAGHVAAVMSALPVWTGGPPAWIACTSILVWCLTIYLAIRVKLDVAFFDLMATYPAEELDEWLTASGLRKNARPRSIEERCRAALRLWRGLAVSVTIQLALTLVAWFVAAGLR